MHKTHQSARAHTFDSHHGQKLIFVFWEPVKCCLPMLAIVSKCRQARSCIHEELSTEGWMYVPVSCDLVMVVMLVY